MPEKAESGEQIQGVGGDPQRNQPVQRRIGTPRANPSSRRSKSPIVPISTDIPMKRSDQAPATPTTEWRTQTPDGRVPRDRVKRVSP